MTRKEAKELLPIIKALAEGKTIQDKIEGVTDWVDTDEINLEYNGQKIIHRIKPESKYRPFKNSEECWNEMLKHQPFGWVKYKETGTYVMISTIYSSTTDHLLHTTNSPEASIDCCEYSFSGIFDNFCFVDGIPFGIKEIKL